MANNRSGSRGQVAQAFRGEGRSGSRGQVAQAFRGEGRSGSRGQVAQAFRGEGRSGLGVALGIKSEATGEAMYFSVGEDFTAFADDYTKDDLTIARALLLDLADALTTRLNQKAH